MTTPTLPDRLLAEAYKQTLASLVAAVSLLERGGKKAAPSDSMFAQMLTDYRAAIDAGRQAFALLDGQPAGVDSTGDSPEDHACFIEACADTFAQTGRPTTARTLREAATELRRLSALGGGGGRG